MRLAALTFAAALAAPFGALAQGVLTDNAPNRAVTVAKDKSQAFRLFAPAGEIVVAQPEMIQIVATTDRSFYIRGKSVGETNILVYDRARRLSEVIDVRVGFDTDAIEADLKEALPEEKIQARNVAGGVMLVGDVSTTAAAARAVGVAERYAPKAVSSHLTVRASQQVVLEVRILEAGRSALQDIGFSATIQNNSGFVFATQPGLIGASAPQGVLQVSTNIGTTRIDAMVQALEQKGIVRTLAKPNLVALSGEEASFLAGGEFPFPVPSGLDQVTIEFKPFGVTLKFTPVVQDNGLIRLKVNPEVSSLDARQALRINGFDVPSLTVRRANTVLELRDGESFAIAGLFQQDYANSMRQIPGIGSVPVLGALFRSSNFKKQESELVIIVTPRLSTAGGPTPAYADPLASGQEPSAIDLILMGKALDQPMRGVVRADAGAGLTSAGE
jgi:pilus assembly protein CpaC